MYLVHIISSQLCAPVCVHLGLCSHLLFSGILELLGGRGHSFFISLLDEQSLGVNLRVSSTLLPDESTGLLSSAESEGMLVEQQCPPPHGCAPHLHPAPNRAQGPLWKTRLTSVLYKDLWVHTMQNPGTGAPFFGAGNGGASVAYWDEKQDH